ncbi:hypothetical protein [Sulfurovum sp. NBC37-1]|uniref:hypothetical protein n=1 Tax=Sulfurovum sp. (strain NBC37-1) TaxID=387093 RepID=UPI0001587A0B|nr:hypothetical protein [Sulfurovum sp. NBC37-1]BAF72976.1 hypothetical protein SUN_2034 [Sulfurovum sp. NBC37-1]
MRIIGLVFLIWAMAELHAKEIQWKSLQNIYKYSASDFHLRDDIVAMEIRCYDTYDNYKKYNKPTVEMKFYKTSLNLLDSKLVKRFQKAAPNLSKNGNIHRTSKVQ